MTSTRDNSARLNVDVQITDFPKNSRHFDHSQRLDDTLTTTYADTPHENDTAMTGTSFTVATELSKEKVSRKSLLAKEVLKKVDSMPQPRDGETWFGVDSRFFDKLDALEAESGPMEDEGNFPAICNKRHVEGQYLKPKVTKRTPLKSSMIDNLTFVHQSVWKRLKELTEYDTEIPRQVVPSEHGGFNIEKQPICIWLVIDGSTTLISQRGLQGTPKSEFYLSNDPLELLLKAAAGEMGCEINQISLYKADHLGDSRKPPNNQAVGKWQSLDISDKEKSLRELGLTEAVVVHAFRCSKPVISDTTSSPLPPVVGLFSSDLWLKENEPADQEPFDAGATHLGSGGNIGLQNLGNTCFMNSALQCLSHTMPLTEFFLSGRYSKDLNVTNPLGMKGRLAEAYHSFLREVFKMRPGSRTRPEYRSDAVVVPRGLKHVVSQFAPQFIGYQQQDSQEFTAFLLDGLHEDLNRVLNKPYMESVEGDDSKDSDELAIEAWKRHQARNDSFIVDTFQGQYRSRLECPVCNKVSIVFDPFMYLSVPLPTVQDIPLILTLLMPSSGKTPCGVCFGLVINSEMSQMEVKYHIAQQIVELLKQLMNELECVKTEIAKYDSSNNPEYQETERKREEIGSLIHDINWLEDFAVSQNVPMESIIVKHLALLQCRLGDLSNQTKNSNFLHSNSKLSVPSVTYGRPQPPELLAYLVRDKIVVELVENRFPSSTSHDFSVPDSTPSSSIQHSESSLPSSPGVTLVCSSPAAAKGSMSAPCPPTNSHISAAEEMLTEGRTQYEAEEKILGGGVSSSLSKGETVLMLNYCISGLHFYQDRSVYGSLHRVSLEQITCRDVYNHRHSKKEDLPYDETLLLDVVKNEHNALSYKVFPLYVVAGEIEPNVYIPSWKDIDIIKRLHETPAAPQPVQLEKCLDEFLKEEQLGPDNMWYCNKCKEHRQAKKRIEIWKLPKILIIHLKRFNQTSRHCRSKNNAEVLFESNNRLDLSRFIRSSRLRALPLEPLSQCPARSIDTSSDIDSLFRYDLFAVSNHMGGLTGGHYTATVKCRFEKENDQEPTWRWMDFNDTFVSPSCAELCGSSAYLLFFQREDMVDKNYSIDSCNSNNIK